MQKIFLAPLILVLVACSLSNAAPDATQPGQPEGSASTGQMVVPHGARWGIYRLGIDSQSIELLYTSPMQIASLRLNGAGDSFVFSEKVGGESSENEEIFTLRTDGSENRNITPQYFPPQFLCHWAVFSHDDTAVYFIGEWWRTE